MVALLHSNDLSKHSSSTGWCILVVLPLLMQFTSEGESLVPLLGGTTITTFLQQTPQGWWQTAEHIAAKTNFPMNIILLTRLRVSFRMFLHWKRRFKIKVATQNSIFKFADYSQFSPGYFPNLITTQLHKFKLVILTIIDVKLSKPTVPPVTIVNQVIFCIIYSELKHYLSMVSFFFHLIYNTHKVQ